MSLAGGQGNVISLFPATWILSLPWVAGQATCSVVYGEHWLAGLSPRGDPGRELTWLPSPGVRSSHRTGAWAWVVWSVAPKKGPSSLASPYTGCREMVSKGYQGRAWAGGDGALQLVFVLANGASAINTQKQMHKPSGRPHVNQEVPVVGSSRHVEDLPDFS